VEAPDFLRYPRVIALSRREHEPMLRTQFPEHAARVDYMEIGDIDIEPPTAALARLAQELDALVAALREAPPP
jgi:protein-tyrosine phosphatase